MQRCSCISTVLAACLLFAAGLCPLALAANNRTDSAYSPGITGSHPPLSHRNQDTLSGDRLHQAPHTPPGAYHDSGRVSTPQTTNSAPHNDTYSRNVNPRTTTKAPDSPYHDYNTTPPATPPHRAPANSVRP